MSNLPILPTDMINKIGGYNPLIGSLNTTYNDKFNDEMMKYSKNLKLTGKYNEYKKDYILLMDFYHCVWETYLNTKEFDIRYDNILTRILSDLIDLKNDIYSTGEKLNIEMITIEEFLKPINDKYDEMGIRIGNYYMERIFE